MLEMYPPHKNQLLAALPPLDYERISPDLELVALNSGQVLYESGVQMSHVYFPIDSVVSLRHVMKGDTSTEIAIVGNEGIVGFLLFIGGDTAPNLGVVQSNGYAYRFKGQQMKDEFYRAGSMQQLLLHYLQKLLPQLTQ